ncbi:MAG: carboxypeptidase-like regulatory domain-containing protein [Saprospiraceae bacterium]|nr:carboxypeptidase-like regulatory domain-containing protein [Saprospiraceae bacterium]
MKTKIYLLVFFTCAWMTPVRADDLLARRLSVSFEAVPIRQALDEVARLANFEWSYNAGILETNRRVSLQARDWTVREILRELLGDQYQFKSNGKYLILKKQKPPKSELSGVVRDPVTGERLANVTVYDKKTLRAATTDSSGYYRLKVKRNAEIVVSRLGYRDTILQVNSETNRYQKLELKPVIPDSSKVPLSIQRSIKNTYNELEYFFNATLDKWHSANVPDTLHRRFQVSFLPKLGTNHVLSDKVTNDISLNILAGQSAGVGAVEVAGLGNFTKHQVEGVQVAGLFNDNRGYCSGVQVAGLVNRTADTLTGVQTAGLLNVAGASPYFSVQVAGLVNIIRSSQADSMQNNQAVVVQVGGLFNHCNHLTGVQVAGLINHGKEVSGVQVAGVLNRVRKMRGIQIGLSNHADELKGVQIGLINRSGKRWFPFINIGW